VHQVGVIYKITICSLHQTPSNKGEEYAGQMIHR